MKFLKESSWQEETISIYLNQQTSLLIHWYQSHFCTMICGRVSRGWCSSLPKDCTLHTLKEKTIYPFQINLLLINTVHLFKTPATTTTTKKQQFLKIHFKYFLKCTFLKETCMTGRNNFYFFTRQIWFKNSMIDN